MSLPESIPAPASPVPTAAETITSVPLVLGPRSLTEDAKGYYFLRIKCMGSPRHELLGGKGRTTIRRVYAARIKPSTLDALIRGLWESNPGQIVSFRVEPIIYKSIPLFTASATSEIRHAS